MTIPRLVLALVFAVIAAPCPAADISLEMPVECAMGQDCYIQNYVDRDPGPEHLDFMCGRLSYDGHDGTDIAVKDLPAMRRGVNVLAAAPGVVRAVRDGMPDINVKAIGRDAVRGKEAGNAVVIVHQGGYETQYSHLKKGSVRVKPGDSVQAGRIIGQIGMSGVAEFPHVEFSVRKNGRPVDPFVGLTDRSGCGFTVDPLWSEAAAGRLGYVASGLLAAGMTSAIPNPDDTRDGRHRARLLSFTAPMIIFWVDTFGVRPGDEERATLTAPDGTVLADSQKSLSRHRARHFLYVGKKRTRGPWPEGEYVGRYELRRNENGRTVTVIDAERRIMVR